MNRFWLTNRPSGEEIAKAVDYLLGDAENKYIGELKDFADNGSMAAEVKAVPADPSAASNEAERRALTLQNARYSIFEPIIAKSRLIIEELTRLVKEKARDDLYSYLSDSDRGYISWDVIRHYEAPQKQTNSEAAKA